MYHQPFFSIIIPSYNRVSFLQKNIPLFLQQDYTNFEIIIIDDGSTDNTREVVEGLIGSEPRLQYIYQPNAERGAARNNGIKNAKGEFVLFIDSDDLMLPCYLSKLSATINNNPSFNFYCARYYFVKNEKKIPADIDKLSTGVHSLETVLKGNPFACNFCLRKNNPSLILFNEDRSLATTEDWMFLVENLFNNKICVADFYGIEMLQHDDRSMQNNQQVILRRLKATEELVKKLQFSLLQRDLLWSYTYSFCGIHAYLDSKRMQSLNFIRKAIKIEGPNIYFLKLAVKFVIGRAAIQLINAFKK